VTAVAAVTIRRSEEDVRRLWDEAAGGLPSLDEVRLSPAPGGRGTEVRVAYEEGGLVDTVRAIAGRDPRRQVEDGLRRLKQVLETGDVVRTEASPEGPDAPRQRHQPPAQPAGDR
jgi:uncharacterized membrane protein